MKYDCCAKSNEFPVPLMPRGVGALSLTRANDRLALRLTDGMSVLFSRASISKTRHARTYVYVKRP